MILSARMVKNPIKIKSCEYCTRLIFSNMLKLYGMAHSEDSPYNLFFHSACAIKMNKSQEPKIERVLQNAD